MVYRLPPLGSVLVPLTLFLQTALSAGDYTTSNNTTPHDNTENCTCYVVNSGADSNTPEYFQYYRFFDFRNLADEPGQYVDAPPLVNDTQDAGDEDVWDANILNSDAWNTDWGIQNWSKPATEDFPTRMVNSPANIFISQNDDENDALTWLTLRTTRLEDFQSAAEIENEQKNVMHVSMRMYAKVTGSKGAVAGFFTFFDDTNESDIEILTDDPTDVIRYTNQPAVDKEGNEVAAASLAPDRLPAWDDWQTHRIDWLPKNSYWYLNDKQVAANTYSVPRKPSGLVVNMWSDGGEWSGNMSVGDSAEFHIQWIEMTFNTSGPVEGAPGGNKKRDLEILETRKDKGCKVVCKIDGVKTVGTPEVVSVAMAAGVSVSWGLLAFVGLVSLLAAL
ncbi:glycoside hydrolase family 16 protein [Trematosphaeria pertusa]|uniref:Glycoside hydrolase family 16 protein n=1 Tax=Trematosphaeria pertusa TaxID=390896 RepID=A0A6A6IZB9_9PLEO|nr:glycoside hydrolase family 16 protein [Trematosphaeria pertusa]KAF2255706.1 glycoside hydrolase family 16 protein [Trematosphaeria pertusa]